MVLPVSYSRTKDYWLLKIFVDNQISLASELYLRHHKRDRFALVKVGFMPLTRLRVLAKGAGFFYMEWIICPVVSALFMLLVFHKVENVP